MDNGIYIALSRQLALFRAMDVTAQNIANVNTTGYNAEEMTFRSFLEKDVNGKMAFTQDVNTYRDVRPGPMKVTGGALDVAISGRGYFVVETPLGERYTRAGNFQVDGGGTLVTAEGYPVLDNTGQRIVFEDDDREIRIGEEGNLFVDGEERAVIGVVTFASEQKMQQAGSNFFKSDVAGTPMLPGEVRVLHGTLEQSNVQPVTEMTQMIQITRAVTNTAKYIETMYDLQRKASNIYAKQA